MTLVELREQFIKYSGRYDLVVNTTLWADNGADFFIQAAQKWLDATYLLARTNGRYFVNVGAGGWYALIPSMRVVYQLWMSSMTEARWEVDVLSLAGLRQLYPGDFSQIEPGSTRYFAPIHLRNIPDVLDTITVDQLGDVAYTVAGDPFMYNGVIFAPPPSADVLIEVYGAFRQPPLVNDDDENWWSVELPQALVMAACRQLEISYRNTAGVKDWEESIKTELLGHEFDLADQESAGITQLEG